MMDLFFDQPPSMLRAYGKALLGARKPLRADTLPPLTATLRAATVDAARVARYREVCGAAAGGPAPPAYPHVLATPLHFAIWTHPSFPLRVIGAVHLRNRVRQRRALLGGEGVDVRVRLAGCRETARGTEHDLVTEVLERDGALAWSSESTYLTVARRLPRSAPAARDEPAHQHALQVTVPAATGRRYGRVSGDLNPIHLSPLAARLFGFERPVAHGMWTLARVLAALEDRLPEGELAVDVAFRKPLFLPAGVVLHWSATALETAFAVRNAGGELTHAEGVIRAGCGPG